MKKLFQGKKVTVMGLGLHGGGVGVAKFFVKEGAETLATDLRSKRELKESLAKLKGLPIKFVLGRHREKDFRNADLIIQNPAAPANSPYLRVAKKNKIQIATDIGLFFNLCAGKNKIIGVTGTKGKSSTAAMIYNILKSEYPNVYLAGNIGRTPLEFVREVMEKNGSLIVLEISSQQLEGLDLVKKSPQIAVVTNIYPDHLNRYKSITEYKKAKENIFKYQKAGDVLFLNCDNLGSRNFAQKAKSKVIFFGRKNSGRTNSIVRNAAIQGEHNVSNALAAVSVAALMKVPAEKIKKTLENIKGLPGREKFVAEINGVKFFNDTAATMPDATIAGVKFFAQKFPGANIILICGGEDKGLNYKKLALLISQKARGIILLPGSASIKIAREISGIKNKKTAEIVSVASMRGAARTALKFSRAGDIILFSPAAASFTLHHFLKKKNGRKKFRKNGAGFNMFQNEFDRGNKFEAEVNRLKK